MRSPLEKPSQEEIATTTQKTQLAIQKILDAKLGAKKPKTVAGKQNEATYARYTQQAGWEKLAAMSSAS